MRWVTFVNQGGEEKVGLHFGALGGGKIVDVAAAAESLNIRARSGKAMRDLFSDMLSVIRNEDESLRAGNDVLRAAEGGLLPASTIFQESEIRLISPVPRPTSMRDAYAFRQHVEAARRNRGVPMIPEFDLFPIYYYTNHLAVTGPGELPVRDLILEKLDFELEVAVVIGKGGRNIRAEDADAHIFGYMIMNDWSARHLQLEEMKLNLGPAKGKDFATTLGPYLVTRDELAARRKPSPTGERFDLKMKTWVNAKQVSEGSVADMTWTFAEIIERISYGLTIHSGEVIGSGTVGTGCFMELNGSKITDNQWLKPGDRVELEVEGLGRLTNTITREKLAPNARIDPRTVSGKA